MPAMRAVVLRQTNDLVVLDVPVPEIAPNQALVRMTHCGVCGSDIRYLHGDNPWAKQTLGERHANPANIILGHEVAGVVERVGEQCDPRLTGKRVAVLAFGTCGKCVYCSRGEEHLCPDTQHLGHGAGWGKSEYFYGGMAEFVPVYARWLYVLPDSVTSEAGATLDPLGVAVHGVKATAITPGDTLLILGSGAVGALAAGVARTKGAGRIVVVDISEAALAVARSLGADYAVSSADEARQAVTDASDGLGARGILDTIGLPLHDYLPLLARGGRYVTMTVTEDPQDFSTSLLAGERSISSSCNFQYSDYHDAMELLRDHALDAKAIITHTFALAHALEAFAAAEDKSRAGAVKVMLTNEG